MTDSVKRGDLKTLKWIINRTFADLTAVRVIISRKPGDTPAVDRDSADPSVTFEDAAPDTRVSLALKAADYGVGKLEAGNTYMVEVETSPGPLTHPDSGYETLTVVADLG